MSQFKISEWIIPVWVYIPIFYFLWVSILLMVKRIGFRTFQKFARQTKTPLDDIFIRSAQFPLTLLILTSGAAIAEGLMPSHGEVRHFLIGFKITTVIAIILFVDRLISGFLKIYAHKIDILKTSVSVVQVFIRTILISLGLLILLDSLGVSITPIIASLGIGSLAVALALQPTLENLFSGIQIIIDKPIEEGHFVKLDSGEEGYVHKIGWRSTWLRTGNDAVVILSNKSLVNTKITNYCYPEKEMVATVDLGVHYDSDLPFVERVTVEVGRETLREVEGGVKTFEPVIRYKSFGDFAINFTVVLRVQEFKDIGLIKHEFIKKLHKRYAKEGIIIPYPIQVNYNQQHAYFNKINERLS